MLFVGQRLQLCCTFDALITKPMQGIGT